MSVFMKAVARTHPTGFAGTSSDLFTSVGGDSQVLRMAGASDVTRFLRDSQESLRGSGWTVEEVPGKRPIVWHLVPPIPEKTEKVFDESELISLEEADKALAAAFKSKEGLEKKLNDQNLQRVKTLQEQLNTQKILNGIAESVALLMEANGERYGMMLEKFEEANTRLDKLNERITNLMGGSASILKTLNAQEKRHLAELEAKWKKKHEELTKKRPWYAFWRAS